MSELVPDQAETGLAAALRERQGAAQAAEAADAASGAEASAEAGPLPGEQPAQPAELALYIEAAWTYLDAWMQGWCPTFPGLNPELKRQGIDAAVRVAIKYNLPNPPPEVTLAGVLLIGYGPPLFAGFKLRRARRDAPRDGEADPRS